jgi:16S rRNA processing protein RimM
MLVEDCFLLGEVRRPHGILGEVKAFFDVDFIDDYEDLESVYLLIGGKLTPFFIEEFRYTSSNVVVLRFKGYFNRDQVEALSGSEMYLPLSDLPKLKDDQFYYHEVIGYQVVDATHGPLGHVRKITEMPGHDLIEMDYLGKEVLIPISRAIVLRADTATQTLHTALPEGLLEIYTAETKPKKDRVPKWRKDKASAIQPPIADAPAGDAPEA